jgi:hypothetical protein
MRFATSAAVLEIDKIRGHAFAPPGQVLMGIPRLYATEDTPADDKTIWLHYFAGACNWYVAELSEAGDIAFGYANLGDPVNAEWGYIHLPELAELHLGGDVHEVRVMGDDEPVRLLVRPPVVVERDLYWTARPWREVNR